MADPPTRRVEVPLRRLAPWLAGFESRHGPWVTAAIGASDSAGSSDSAPARWELTADDGTVAVVSAPEWLSHTSATWPGDHADASGALAALAQLRPPFGVLLLRRAGYAVGAFVGPDLVDRKVGSRHIHGRTAAGGWSQQRYARRRANQADEIVLAAAAAADRILGGATDPAPQFLVTGGDRPLLTAALEHVGLSVAALPVAAHLGIGTPDAHVLAGVPDRVLAVHIELIGPDTR